MATNRVDTLIIGAGVIGSSVAMHLARAGVKDVRVIDFDLEGSLSSSELNAGGVRATFLQRANIEMSRLTIDYFAERAEAVGYRKVGYLWLHTQATFPAALEARKTQLAEGWPVEALDVAELKRRAPFIDKTADLAGACFAPKDGLVNPNLVKNHYRAEAKALGVRFDDRALLREISRAPSGGGLHVRVDRYPAVLSHEQKLGALSGVLIEGFAQVEYQASRVVNCAGPWAPTVAKCLGYACPSQPVRRQVALFDCREVDLTPYGMIIDTSGVYFHPEASNGLAGFATPGERPGVNFQSDGEPFFMSAIWPPLFERATGFERLKYMTGWAGLYEVSPDESAIIGEVKGAAGRVYEAHSFSGHGVMHSFAAGKALAERIAEGRYETIDAGVFDGARFAEGREVRERMVI